MIAFFFNDKGRYILYRGKKKYFKVRFITELIINFMLLFDESHRKKNSDESQKEESWESKIVERNRQIALNNRKISSRRF
jgi:hypothetical protein